ncbi:MAG: DNA replication and repair protein RecF [Gemmatimonadota bacterium]|nr:DNA replication and repair protein RecF [Gemmatimonadota bacterium]MDH3477679.1 DNA replication and repair protein RecF [Gemmatimonadota bacterium]MDH3569339.1 DNA replication and repair protein RecF [Gemmatimonadota bacterium]MDH5548805.1 DNA replication and repair protein RecF [Gemmatimonadota bacterium]
MRLTQLTIRTFRNIAALDIELPAEGVVVIGENGEGKTNLLEAIYYLVLFRSLRGAKDRELVRFGDASFFIAGEGPRRVAVGYEIAGRRKKVTVDRVEMKKLADGVGRLTAVAFAPSDRTIVAGGPTGRRRYLDIVLALSEPGYLAALSAMRQALRQRNAALRNGHGDAARAFDAPFAAAAGTVARARRRWVAASAARFQDLCTTLGEAGTCSLLYAPDHHREDDTAGHIEAALRRTFARDTRRGMTTVGPHRDDLRLSLDGRDQRTYGSAGQQRTAAVALRLLEAESLAAAEGSPPVALYDDVFAELDRGRQERLLALIRETLPGQAVVVAPRESEVPRDLLGMPRWTMRGGTLDRP